MAPGARLTTYVVPCSTTVSTPPGVSVWPAMTYVAPSLAMAVKVSSPMVRTGGAVGSTAYAPEMLEVVVWPAESVTDMPEASCSR